MPLQFSTGMKAKKISHSKHQVIVTRNLPDGQYFRDSSASKMSLLDWEARAIQEGDFFALLLGFPWHGTALIGYRF